MSNTDREHCPSDPGASNEPEKGTHCDCWWDNDGPCCFCGDDTMTAEEERRRREAATKETA